MRRGYGHLFAWVTVAATVLAGASACSKSTGTEPPAPAASTPGASELARLTAAAKQLETAKSYKVTYQMKLDDEFFANINGTVEVSLGDGTGRSHGTGHVEFRGFSSGDKADLELIDAGNGTTYVKGTSVGTSAKPWREVTTFNPQPVRGAGGIIAYAELLNSAVFDPRQYITAESEIPGVTYTFKAKSPGEPDTLRATCTEGTCIPGKRLKTWFDQNKLRWVSFDVTVRLSPDNQLKGFDVSFDYGQGASTSLVKIEATIRDVGQPVSVDPPADALISRS
jgi:hypothetical protein